MDREWNDREPIYRQIRDRVVAMILDGILKDGDPATSILRAADDEAADIIVMGRRGLGDLAGLLLGSVSHKVTHLASCACLTVK